MNQRIDWWNGCDSIHDQPLNLLKTKPWIHDQAKSNRGDDLFRKECLIGKTNFMENFQSSNPIRKPPKPLYVPPHLRLSELEPNDDLSLDATVNNTSSEFKNVTLIQDSGANFKSLELTLNQFPIISTNFKELSDSSVSNNINDETVSRIIELANKHMNATFKSKIPEIYSLLYGIDLPLDWLETLEFSVIISNHNSESSRNLYTVPNKTIAIDTELTWSSKISQNHSVSTNLESNNNNKDDFKNKNEIISDQNIMNKSEVTKHNLTLKQNISTYSKLNQSDFTIPTEILLDSKLNSNKHHENFTEELLNKLIKLEPKDLNLECLGKEFKVIINSCKSSIEIWGSVIDESHSKKLQDLQAEMAIFYNTTEKKEEISVKKDFYYAVHDNYSWHRVKCLKNDDSMADVLFIDRGDMNTYPVEKLFTIHNAFCKLPAQAIKMTLTNLENYSDSVNMKNELSQILDKNIFYAKVHHLNKKDKCLFVKLYKDKDNKISVNDLLKKKISMHSSFGLSVEAEPFVPERIKIAPEDIKDSTFVSNIIKSENNQESLCQTNCKEETSAKSLYIDSIKEDNSLSSSSILNHPKVPENGYFDVNVVMTRDPTNFFVQLLREKTLHLKKMIGELEEACVSYTGSKITHKSVSVKKLYACKSHENALQWYRVTVIKILDEKLCTVYFCDYGRKKNIHIANLIPLQEKFYQLPYQAIRAEIHGIKPKFGEWSKTDCSSFKDLTESKNFVALVKNKKISSKISDEPNNSMISTVYELELIDTSTTEDIYISKILVNEGRAVKK